MANPSDDYENICEDNREPLPPANHVYDELQIENNNNLGKMNPKKLEKDISKFIIMLAAGVLLLAIGATVIAVVALLSKSGSTVSNVCDTVTCGQNGGCIVVTHDDGQKTGKCLCNRGYMGSNCQTDIDECMSQPCKNNATCQDMIDSYVCSCQPGYTEAHCKSEIDECMSQPCKNNGTCMDTIDSYVCSCQPGYAGAHCESGPEFTAIKNLTIYNLPYEVSDITDTSDGRLAMVQYGRRAGIFNLMGELETEIVIPFHNYHLWGIARYQDSLVLTDLALNRIFILKNNTFITVIQLTGFVELVDIEVTQNTFWVTDWGGGKFYKLSFDVDYNITNTELVVSTGYPMSVHVLGSRVGIMSSWNMLQMFNASGVQLFPTVGTKGSANGQFNGPRDLLLNPNGQIFVSDFENKRIVVLSENGTFIRNIVTESDGLDSKPAAIFLHGNLLYVTNRDSRSGPHRLYVFELI